MAITPEPYRYVQQYLEQVFLHCPHVTKFAVYKRLDHWGDVWEARWIDSKEEEHTLLFDGESSLGQKIDLAVVTLRMMYGNCFEGQKGSRT